MSNKISKVQLNNELYSLKGDANNIKDVMQPTVDDLYNKITTGADSATILLILENISGLQNSKADKTELNDIWSLINALSARIPNSTINYYFAYKASTQVPQRPGNDLEYVPSGWTGYPIEPNSNEVLYMTMARTLNGNWLNWDGGYRWTLPIAYSDNQLTLNIEGNVALYKLSAGVPTLTDEERRTAAYPSGWSTTPDFVIQDNKEVYMITAKTLNGDFVLIQGYYWSAPMRIGNGTTSGTGADGNSYNYIYFPSSSPNAPSTPTFTVALIELSLHIGGWYDRPLGVSENKMYEYISLSIGNDDNRKGWTTPVLWSKWGERGMDGDAVEYIYKRTETESAPIIPYYDAGSTLYLQDDFVPVGWTDNPLGVDADTSFEYVATRKKKSEVWQRFEGPWLWSKYGKDGAAGVVNGYLMTCNNSSVIADDDLFTKNDALSRFNALASATFTLQKTDGSSINPTYSVGGDSNLPNGIQAVMNGNTLSYTGSFTSTISDGDIFYVNINGKVNNEVVATLRQTILVKNFSSGESYRLILTPTSKKVGTNGKFESNFTIDVKFLVIGSTLSTNVNFAQQDLYYDIEIEGDSNNKAAQNVLTQTTTLNVANLTAPEYYVVNLYKIVNNSGVLVDSLTISIYKDGEKGDKGDPGSGGSSLSFEVTPSVLYFSNNSFTTSLKCTASWNNLANLSVSCAGLEKPLVNGTTTFAINTLNSLKGGNTPSSFEVLLKNGSTTLTSIIVPILYAQQGINGAVLRYRGIWSEILNFDGVARSGATFECNSHTGTGNIDYIDVVSEKVNGELKYYLCVQKHSINPGSSSPTLSSTDHWQVADLFKFIVTDTLIADYISTHTIAADDVVITEKNNQGVTTDIVAGMTSSHVDRTLIGNSDVGDVRIWAGTSGTENLNILNAPFLVTLEGKLIANDVAVLGEVKAISGIFQGQILAKSLKVQNLEDCGMQFKVLEEAITINGESYAAGTPVIMIWQGENVYVVNMTATSNIGKTSYSTQHVCVPVTGTESQILLNLKYCYENNITNLPSESSRFTTRDVYVVFSTDPLLDELYLSTNPNDVSGISSALRFSGIIIDQRLYSEFIQTSSASSGSGIHRYYYNAITYRDGREITTSLITVATVEAENNTVVKSDTALYPVTSTAPEASSQPFGYKITSSQVNKVLSVLNFNSSDLVYPGTAP